MLLVSSIAALFCLLSESQPMPPPPYQFIPVKRNSTTYNYYEVDTVTAMAAAMNTKLRELTTTSPHKPFAVLSFQCGWDYAECIILLVNN